MKIIVTIRAYFVIAFSIFLSISYGQNLFEALEPYTDHLLIQKHNIKSLIVFAEINEDDIRENGGQGGKTIEMEFNNDGYLIYKITSDNEGNLPFIHYGRGSIIQLFTYNMNNLLISSYTENYNQSRCEINKYDSFGNPSSYQMIIGSDTLYRILFEWQGNKMIKSTITNANKVNQNRTIQYDDRGRITHSTFQNKAINILYEQKNDTLITITTIHRSDTLVSTETQKTLIKFNRVVSYVKKDHSGKLEFEMNATLDKNGNATYYYLNLDKRYPPQIFNIQNFYDDRNLLNERIFYSSREDVGNNIMVKIERYFFSGDTLTFKMKEGSILYTEQQEEQYYEACDSGNE